MAFALKADMGFRSYRLRPWHRRAILVVMVLGAGLSLALIALAFRTPASWSSDPDITLTQEAPLSFEAGMNAGSASTGGVRSIQRSPAACEHGVAPGCGGPLSDGIAGPTSRQEPPASAFGIGEQGQSLAGSSASVADVDQRQGRIARLAQDSTNSANPNARRSPGASQGLSAGGGAQAGAGGSPSQSSTGETEAVPGGRTTARVAADGRTSLAPDDARTSATGDLPTSGNPVTNNQGGQGNPGSDEGNAPDSEVAGDGSAGTSGGGTPKGNETLAFSNELNPPGFGEDFGTDMPADTLPGGTGDSLPSARALEFSEEQAPVEAVPVPEPAALVLLGSGLGLTAWQIRRQARRRNPQ